MSPRTVYVLAEHHGGALAPQTFEALAAARSVSDGGTVTALLLGASATPLAAQLGAADAVLHLADPALDAYSPDAYEQALRAALSPRERGLLFAPNTTVGMDIAAGLAGHLGLPMAAYCIALRSEGDQIVATCQIYGGKILADVALTTGVVSLVPGAFKADDGRRAGSPAVETLPPAGGAPRVRLLEMKAAEAADVDITKEKVLVSVGRGIGGPENLPLAEELAAALGGAVAGSRPVTDAGWLPRSRQVGKSGLTVKPKLYLALGISGAPEHLQGMKDSDLIVAVNSDAAAPIFAVAHYGIVGDVLEVVPEITERVKK